MTDPIKKHPILEGVLIATLTTLCTGIINLILEEIKERRKKKKPVEEEEKDK